MGIKMMDEKFECSTPFSDAYIEKIELSLNRKLPDDYRNFVKKFGGAFVGGEVDGSEEFSVLDFFGLEEGNSVLEMLEIYPDLNSDGALPVARCELGNIYVLNNKNEIFYINFYGGKTSATRVSSCFQDFIDRIVVNGD